MKISFYYVEFLKDTEINARGFTRVPNVEYANRKKQLIKKAGVKKAKFQRKTK
ncbi:hypothetical protein [Butyrivibrio sp. AE3004]|uniref:hypothetical protein n=1 Tax=Butyrivibrio sp. AE3004 TaxID=1506994 RepID=UPI000A8A3549|nr:hypothetical protein [Butyrivibrio sp. AE3004]